MKKDFNAGTAWRKEPVETHILNGVLCITRELDERVVISLGNGDYFIITINVGVDQNWMLSFTQSEHNHKDYSGEIVNSTMKIANHDALNAVTIFLTDEIRLEIAYTIHSTERTRLFFNGNKEYVKIITWDSFLNFPEKSALLYKRVQVEFPELFSTQSPATP